MCRSRSGESGDSNLITCNHDTLRTAQRLTERERKLAYATLLMLPGAPFIYYGDELGMRYRPLPSKEGGYTRTGSRTPMQWDDGANLGFSQAAAEALYLPVDPAEDAPTVERAMANKDSPMAYHPVGAYAACRRTGIACVLRFRRAPRRGPSIRFQSIPRG